MLGRMGAIFGYVLQKEISRHLDFLQDNEKIIYKRDEKMQNNLLINRKKCPQCHDSNLVTDENIGEVICDKCGLVIVDTVLNESPEWRAFTLADRQSRSRNGSPISYARFDKGLHTTISGFRDASGQALSAKAKRRAYRLRKWHLRSTIHESRDRNLLQAMTELQMLSEKLHVSSGTKELAAVIYRKALDEDLVRGRSIAAITSASLYVACRLTKTSKTLKDIVEVSSRSRGEVSKAYRLIIRTLKIEMPSHNASSYVSSFAEKAHISGKVQGIAFRILREAERKRITMGKDPAGVAAAVLYIAGQLEGENVTQKDIAQVAGVTEVTIRNRKNELMKKLGINKNTKIDK
jgi:transcription initiation factor TFIIB